MNRLLALPCLLLAAALGGRAAAQDIPGVRVTLVAEQTSLSANQDLSLKLVLDVDKDAEVPGALLTGIELDSRVDDQPGPQIREPGKGGKVALAAGTHIERTLKLPAARVHPVAAAQGLVHIALQWPGFTGANCVVQLAPDLGKVDIGDLDLAKTKVVLVTNFGEMTLAFYPDRAPGTVKNFVKLAKDGFYDGTKFHRVIRNFMIQGGDPLTKDDSAQDRWGTGGPGYTIRGEVNDTKHVRGVVSMANSGSPDTAGSQFFICHKDAPHLNQGYTAFGALEKGLDVLDAIASVPCGGPEHSRPQVPVVLQHALVLPAFKK